MLVNLNLSNKIPSEEIIDIQLNDLKQLNTTLFFKDSNLVVFDIDEPNSREILLQAHKDKFLSSYVYSIKENGSAHFYFRVKKKTEYLNKHIFYDLYNLHFEVLCDKVNFSNEQNSYQNFDKFFSKENFEDIPYLEEVDQYFLFKICGAALKEENGALAHRPFTSTPAIYAQMEAMYGKVEQEQRAKSLLAIAPKILTKWTLVPEQLLNIFTFIDTYIFKQSLLSTDGPKSLTNLVKAALEFYQENVAKNLSLENILEQHKTFLKYDKTKKEPLIIDYVKLAIYLIEKYELRVRNQNLYGMKDNMYVCYSLPFEDRPNLLYERVLALFETYHITNKFSPAIYKQVEEHIFNLAPIFNDKELSDMNISLKNGTLIFNKETNTYSFSNIVLPHIILFNHIEWIEEDKINKAMYEEAKQVFDNYLASLHSNVEVLWTLIANSFLYNNYIRKAFILTGNGLNGKSTFMSVLQQINGANHSNISIEDINSQFMGHKLANHTLNTCGEISGVISGTDTILKSVISGDKLSMDVKNQKEGIDFANKSTLVFATNSDLVIPDYTTALLKRLFFIDFNREFEPDDIEDFINKKVLISKYSYLYILKTSLSYIEKMKRNKWKIYSKDDENQQFRFKINNSQVFNFFLYNNFLEADKKTINQEGLKLLRENNVISIYNFFHSFMSSHIPSNASSIYRMNKFNQQMKDVMNLDTDYNIKDKKGYFVLKGDKNE